LHGRPLNFDMQIMDNRLTRQAQMEIIAPLLRDDIRAAGDNIPSLLDGLYANIPDNKRISYGRVHTIKELANYLHNQLLEKKAPGISIASKMVAGATERRTIGVALCLLSLYAKEAYPKVIAHFEMAAMSADWEVREFSQMFFRKIIQHHPERIQPYLLKTAQSREPNLRRFVAETLRPCVETKWIYKQPAYSMLVLRHLFYEKAAYPRTAVGNNLSDLARRLPELVYDVIAELVGSGDKNAYWIAYRACRNLVKKEPKRVMDLLKIDEYRYKKRVYYRPSASSSK